MSKSLRHALPSYDSIFKIAPEKQPGFTCLQAPVAGKLVPWVLFFKPSAWDKDEASQDTTVMLHWAIRWAVPGGLVRASYAWDTTCCSSSGRGGTCLGSSRSSCVTCSCKSPGTGAATAGFGQCVQDVATRTSAASCRMSSGEPVLIHIAPKCRAYANCGEDTTTVSADGSLQSITTVEKICITTPVHRSIFDKGGTKLTNERKKHKCPRPYSEDYYLFLLSSSCGSSKWCPSGRVHGMGDVVLVQTQTVNISQAERKWRIRSTYNT